MRVVVVGGGVIGLSVAYYAQKAGADVTVLTARAVGAGASAVNAGWVTPALSSPVPGPGVLTGSLKWMLSPSSPFYARPRLDPGFLRWLLAFRARCNARDLAAGTEALGELNRRTFGLYDELRADGLSFDEHRTGLLMAYTHRAEAEHEVEGSRWLERFGLPLPVLGDPQELEPALSDEIHGAFLYPVERHVDPATLAAAMAACITARGGEVRTDTTVDTIEPGRSSGGDLAGARAANVIAGSEQFPAHAVVVAAGAWTPRVLNGVPGRVPVIAGKGYALDFAPAPIALRRPLYLHESRVGVSPYDGRIRLAGTMELTGISESISRRRVDAIARAAARALRGWPAEGVPTAVNSGMRPLTPDGLPVVGRLPRAPGVWVASGHSMLGVTLAPATGAALAEALLTGAVPDVLRPFDPARFT